MRLLYSLLFCLFALCAQASTYVTATLTITNNPSGTNGQVLTIGSDTRTWTNSVYAAATQVLAGTNATLSAQNLLVHISAHAFTGLTLYGSGTNWLSLRTAADGASPSITVSTNWASVTLATNTVTAATVLRLPITVESAAVQTNLASLLAAALNSGANTTLLSKVAWSDFDASGITNVARATNADAAVWATNIAGAGVSGAVAQATHATNADLATLATQATHATNADNAVWATNIAAAGISGAVAQATHSTNSDNATYATTATTATNLAAALDLGLLDWSKTNTVTTNAVALKIPVLTNDAVVYYLILFTNAP